MCESIDQGIPSGVGTVTIGFAGAGNVAQALGRRLRERGLAVVEVSSRSPERARRAALFIGGQTRAVPYEELRADRVIIAVPDAAIRLVAQGLRRPAMVLHTSGAWGCAEIASPARDFTNDGSLHPLQTFPTPEEGYRALPGCTFAVDGGSNARAWAIEIAQLLDGQVVEIPPQARALYHTAAVMASNHLTATMDAAMETLVQVGLDRATAQRALANISRAALENTLRDGAERALTGPVARGDAETVARHIKALENLPMSIRDLYRAAARHTVEIARRRGLPSAAAHAVMAAIGSARE